MTVTDAINTEVANPFTPATLQVPVTVTDAINTEVANVRKLLEGETSAESIKEAVSNLQKALMKIGEHLAQSGQVCNQALPHDHKYPPSSPAMAAKLQV